MFLFIFIHLMIPAIRSTVIKPMAVNPIIIANLSEMTPSLYSNRIIETAVSMINDEISSLI